MNLGYMVRGIDLAVASGRMAAEAACKAIDAGSTDEAGLSSYRTSLEESFVIKDLKTFRKWPGVMEGWSRMFNAYPALCKDIFASLFVVDGRPLEPLVKRLMPHIKKIGILNLLKDVRGAMKAL
jgi:electron transfer flavoprotein-quinone oxidoreductase